MALQREPSARVQSSRHQQTDSTLSLCVSFVFASDSHDLTANTHLFMALTLASAMSQISQIATLVILRKT